MKRLTTSIIALGLLGCLQASATLTLRLSADGGQTWVSVADGGPMDSNPTTGIVQYSGPVGSWFVDINTGFGSPLLGNSINPEMDLGTTSSSSDSANLIVQLSDTGFTPFPNETFILQSGGFAGGSVVYTAYRDSGNVQFGTTATYAGDPAGISPSPTASILSSISAVSGNYQASNTVVVANGTGPFALTLETVLVHNSATHSSTDSSLTVLPPPPCNCTLTFNAPQFLTNCVGDAIPDVTASQSCDGGVTQNPVTPTLVSAVTNGSCPTIITRNYTATDTCGDIVPFTQTIVVNCRGNICGHVFADCDGDGDLSAGDVGIAKVTVTLLDNSGHVIKTTVSDVNGGYCFTNLAGGNYVVTINPPANYCQTAASTSYHWKDSYGRICWQENDGYIHCLSSGTECWWDKSNNCHTKDSYNRDCWKDNYGSHCQPLSYKSCNAPANNNTISVSLTNCTSLTDVDFAYAGTKPCVAVSCTGPGYVKCGQSYTYTCCVTNTGNVCFKGGNVCTTVGNCNNWGGWGNNCNNFTGNCPPLSPGQSCKFTVKCSFNSWNCGTVTCQSQVNCSPNYGNNSCAGQSTCYSQCGY